MFNWFKKKDKLETVQPEVQEVKNLGDDNTEIAAAISVALNLYLSEVHDYEQAIITMQKVMRPYSPWSSKIYGLRQIPIKTKTFNL